MYDSSARIIHKGSGCWADCHIFIGVIMEYFSNRMSEISEFIRACHCKEYVTVFGAKYMIKGYWPVNSVPPEPVSFGFKLTQGITNEKTKQSVTTK